VDDYRGAVAFRPAPPAPKGVDVPTIQIPPADDVFFAPPVPESDEAIEPVTDLTVVPETVVGEVNEPAND